jgi:hypothetical protein
MKQLLDAMQNNKDVSSDNHIKRRDDKIFIDVNGAIHNKK